MTSPYSTGVVGTFALSGNASINPLLVIGFKWGSSGAGTSAAISYSFPTYGSLWHPDYTTYLDNEPFINFQPFDSAQQNAARQAIALWAEVANITFTEVDDLAGDNDVGDIRFGNSGAVTNSTSAAWAYMPYDDIPYAGFVYPENGDVWFDYEYQPNLQLAPGQFGFSTMVHEIGHAIGLDHPFADVPGELALPAAQNNQRYTIMAYNLYSGATIEAYGPMLYDILALQYIYGANMTTGAGDDVYTFQTDKEYLECIWDAGGHDTIDLSNQTRNQVIDLREGTFSSIGIKNNNQTAVGNVGIAFNVTIEDAIGGKGHDKITGNNADNSLQGGIGNDTLVGGAGNDTLDGGPGVDSMTGGKGNDLYRIDNALDKAIEVADEGTDTIESTVTYSLVAAPNIEILKLVGAGNLNGTGSSIANTLIGNSGNNILDGGAGADTLKGGAGNDTYILDNVGDFIDEEGNTDSGDTIKTSALISGAFAGIENYTYTGAKSWTFTADDSGNAISGGAAGDKLDGAGGNDTLLGNGGNDTLIGGIGDDWLDGGIGNDKMFGGTGNDTYLVNAAGDTIDESGADDSDDLVRSSVTINLSTLGAGKIEHAVLLGSTAIHVTGNDSDNHLTGNAGANKLDGGKGADTMVGGNGADIYTVDDLGDEVTETTGGTAGGIDLVMSSVTFELGANLEKLTLTGSGNINGTGNALNNTILGNSGANRLDGGTGNDTMTGGKGNDTYVVDSIKDVVNETVLNSAGGGVDTVESSVTFSLATRANIENLLLTGSGDINGTGNALKNAITGNSGNNILNGGTGADTLKGGAGNDVYILDNAGDVVDEEANTDSGDEVKTTAPIAAAFAGIENYTYTGTKAWNFTGTTADNKISGGSVSDTLNGGEGNDTLLGNGGNDTLIGEDGNDWLDGGVGNDKMKGGAGNDTYVVNAVGDSIDEEGNADTNDLVKSSVTINLVTLGAGLIENAELIGTTAINATGNASNNKLTGNSAANKLDGGAGADTMTGGNGADTYTVDNADDKVVETTAGAAGGIDLVLSSIDYTLGANAEKLTLTGTGDINGTGNNLNNTLIGNTGANILDGGAGNDTMTGGKGDDTYIVNSTGDVVSETVLNSAGGGVDTVESSVTFTLATRTNIEHLTLTGSGNINGTGNALNNEIIGNSGNNILNGGTGNDVLDGGLANDTLIGGTGNDFLHGGQGIDKLTGGAGRDTFDFDLIGDAGDTITDFVKGASGDILNLADLLASFGDPLDPFGGGYLEFFQSGTSTLVHVDANGGMDNVTILATLLNVTLTQADTSNYVLV